MSADAVAWFFDDVRKILRLVIKIEELPWLGNQLRPIMLRLALLLSLFLSSLRSSSASRITLTPPPNNVSTATRPETLNSIWSIGPGLDWFSGAYPIGNGYLGETILGRPANDAHYINIASLWTGGPFRNSTYSGGNSATSKKAANVAALANVRQQIMANGTGSVAPLMGDFSDPDYGSYATAGALHILSPSQDALITSFTRSLDFDQGLVNISWTEGNVAYNRISFCSHPDQVCITHTSANTTSLELTYALSTPEKSVPAATCSNTGSIKLRGRLNDSTDGIATTMLYEVQALVLNGPGSQVVCNPDGTVKVTGTNESWVIWTGETEFDLAKCNRASGFTCRGDDPTAVVTSILQSASSNSFSTLLARHVSDYSSLSHAFTLDIGQSNNAADIHTPTDQLVNNYSYTSGSPLLEHNIFSYGRHLLISSTRSDTQGRMRNLPPNLQGIWMQGTTASWGSDFHYDINFQMMQWPGESTGIADGIVNSGNWMLYAMADRGTDTADILYGADGFVFHTSSNVFGYTGMQGYSSGTPHAEWADFTASPAWILQHLYDHFVYDPSDTAFLKAVTYPLMKSHAKFQMSFLVEDNHFKDGTLVVAPCNSPEQGYTTLGCTWNQQQIFELLHNIRKIYASSGDNDTAFINQVETTLAKLYDGVRVGKWGQLQEWKVDRDSQTDQHRHLSHLLGVYPGWEISGYMGQSLGNASVLKAAQVSLTARGNGTVDSDAGWEKVMRSVIASSLENAAQAILEYRWMIYSNLNGNLLSMYDGHQSIFQMDANGGAPAATLNMLFQSLDSTQEFRNVTHVKLLPALPSAWSTGSFTGGRLRDGLSIDMSWLNTKIKAVTIRADRTIESRAVALHSALFKGNKVTGAGVTDLGNGTVTFSAAKGSTISLSVS